MENERPVRSRIRVRSGPGGPPSVDGHPGWVEKSTEQHVALCAIFIAMQGTMVGLGPVLTQAKSAAWWCMVIGLAAGFLIWIPLWGIMRGEKARTLDEALCVAFGPVVGGAFSMVYALLFLIEVMIMLEAACAVVCQRMLLDSDERVVSLTILAVVTLMLFRNQVRGFSRFVWLFRITIVSMCAISMFFLFDNARLNHLFPLMGEDQTTTLLQIPTAAGGMTGIILLGLLPRETGSAQPVKMRFGVLALFIGGFVSIAYTLLTNLCVSPLAIPSELAWGTRLMLSSEFNQHRAFRLVYIVLLALKLILAIGAGMAGCGMLAQRAVRAKTWRWPLGITAAFLAVKCIVSGKMVMDISMEALRWFFPAALIPLWLAWIVLLIKKRRKRGGAA